MATSCGDIVHGLPGYGEQLAIVPLDLIGIPPVRACQPQADLASEQRLYACSRGTAVGFRALASSPVAASRRASAWILSLAI